MNIGENGVFNIVEDGVVTIGEDGVAGGGGCGDVEDNLLQSKRSSRSHL